MNLKWIEGLNSGRLMVSPAPPGGDQLEAVVAGWSDTKIHTVVSMLRPDEIMRMGLIKEGEFCSAKGIEFLSCPVLDHCVPESPQNVCGVALRLSGMLEKDKSILIHCYAGIGRSVLMASCVLALTGVPPPLAFERISTARGIPGLPETMEQREWVMQFARQFSPRSR